MSKILRSYNYSKLLGIMRENAVTQGDLARKIGISEVSLNKKLRNKSQFKQEEMESILSAFGMTKHDVATIFFNQ